jgi:hypothetical protein
MPAMRAAAFAETGKPGWRWRLEREYDSEKPFFEEEK